MKENKKINSKDIIKATLTFALLVIFMYFAGYGIGQAIGYLK